MQKTLLIIFILGMSCICAFAQSGSIRGAIIDKGEKKPLQNASILILRLSDSSLISFIRSKANGDFMISKLPSGKITLMVLYPAYADYVEEMTISDTSALDLGSINMIGKAELLQEVVVSNAAAIRIKGDTTEYKVDSFHMAAGASVEEMLSKLPGIQVDRNGKITAQGETVQKVLVDGEEFFSDDPTIVTKNMLSSSIDKVQVYDKKSDQSAFTGIDDGKKSKTIDLKLKDDRKKGY
ncbi:MAG: carboxypeptidase-like regulatory domain-containing protein, partial [Flavitalea sp.]